MEEKEGKEEEEEESRSAEVSDACRGSTTRLMKVC